MGSNSILKCNNLSVGFSNSILENINIQFSIQNLYAIIGENGSGKTTFLKTLYGQLTALSGSVQLKDKNLSEYNAKELAKEIAIVLSHFDFKDHLNVEEVISLGRFTHTNWLGILNDDDKQIVNEAISFLGIEPLAQKSMQHLSDGETQKVLIARALAQNTPIIILDEPSNHLDVKNKWELYQLLQKIAKEKNKCIILSSHDIDMILPTCDYVMHPTKDGQLKLQASGSLNKEVLLKEVFTMELASLQSKN